MTNFKQMRHLAFRFVRHTPSVAGTQFVVDPYLDYRTRLNSEWRKSLERRQFHGDYDLLTSGFNKWWQAFDTYSKDQSKLNKADLLDNSDGLTNVLKLPNHVIDLNFEESVDQSNIDFLEVDTKNKAEILEWLGTQVRAHFDTHLSPVVQRSPSYRVRPVFLDACNLSETSFPRVGESNNLFTSLVGVSFPSHLAMFMKMEFSKQNSFPLNFLAVGASYYQKSTGTGQRMNASLLTVDCEENAAISSFYTVANSIALFLRRLHIDYTSANVDPTDLRAFEAACTKFSDIDGNCLARVSFTGTYVSERLNIRVENKKDDEPKFVILCHSDVNLSKIGNLLNK